MSEEGRLVTSDHLEPFLPVLLGLHCLATLLLVVDSTWVQLVLAGAVTAAGVAGLCGWHGRSATQARGLALTATAFVIPLTDHTMVPHMLHWWYAIVAVYPLILPRRQALGAAVASAAVLMLHLPLGAATPGSTTLTWSLRCLVLGVLGVIVALAGESYRRAQTVAEGRQADAERIGRELAHADHHDALTGLPNRKATPQLIDDALGRRSGAPGDEVAVLLFDLDRFRHVNESLGHFTGDLLLRDVAARVERALDEGQHMSRLGGDEFLIVCENSDERRAHEIARHLVDLFGSPVNMNGSPYQVSLSVGVTVSGPGLDNSSELMRAADAAMYAAKAAGRGRAVSYDTRMRDAVEAQLQLERRLRSTLSGPRQQLAGTHEGSLTEDGAASSSAASGTEGRSEIFAVFQPVVDVSTGQVVGAEALARWDLDGHAVSPLEFVPLAEELGLAADLTRVIARQSVEALASWRAAGLTDVRSIAVNVGPAELLEPSLAEWLAALVSEHGLPEGSLSLEITERDVVVDTEEARAAMQRLGRHGITVAVDDFGTGFSSLAYLARLPLHVLKIDRAFVEHIEDDPTIARMVVYLARSFGMGCIAEGVETQAQLQVLRDLGVGAAQGWLLGRPVRAADFLAGSSPLVTTADG
ncbi:MAG TPA: EAL domain-containing protein [Actinomycetales bacterium]|nr:EAL domain-containing protein [Actinomycetales bacterium]